MEEEKNKNEEPQEQKGQEGRTQDAAQKAAAPGEENLETKLADALKQAETYKDLLYRKAAEFENYKKRSENEVASVIKHANEGLITDMLPVVDDFERSLKAAKASKEFESLYKGIELIYQKLVKHLEKRGVKSFETVGKEFDVEFHDALLQMPREDVAPHTVLEEVEKGYTLHDKVIRHAKVIVSTLPADGVPTGNSSPSAPEDKPQPGEG